MDTLEIQIPFCGFYESEANDMIDNEIETSFMDDNGISHIPDDFWYKWSSKETMVAFSKAYVADFVAYVNDWTNLNLSLEFKELVSPREYNFETDRIFCTISQNNVKALFDDTSKDKLALVIKERHSSHCGFFSFYNTELGQDEWSLPVTEWDSVQLQTLLMAYLDDKELLHFNLYEIMERSQCNGVISSVVWDNCPKECLDMLNQFYADNAA